MIGKRIFPAYCILGFVGLGAEVAWARLLSLSIGSSTYALSTMLASYMAGIALGSWAMGRRIQNVERPARLLAATCLLLAASIAVSPILASFAPRLVFPLLKFTYAYSSLFYLAVLPVAAMVMAIPAFLLGVAFPLAARLTSDIRDLSALYALNTVGAVAGALLSGFLLIPLLGLTKALIAISLLAAAASVLLTWDDKEISIKKAASVIFVIALSLFLGGKIQISGLENIHIISRSATWEELTKTIEGETVFFEEGAFGPVVVRQDAQGARALYVAGRNESSNQMDIGTTVGLALLPISAHPGSRSIFILGLGTGTTAFAAARLGLDVTVAEIEPVVARAVESAFFPKLLESDSVHLILGDATNELLYGDHNYDIFVSEPSYPADASTSRCFSEDFYRIVDRRLNPGGVVCQWVPPYLLEHEDIAMLGRTFASVFHDASLWKSPSGDLFLLGYKDRASFDELALERAMPGAAHFFKVPTPKFLSRIQPGAGPTETDDRPRLEFAAARNLVARSVRQ